MANTLPVILENNVVTDSKLEMTFFFKVPVCFVSGFLWTRKSRRELARLLKTKELWEVVYALVPEAHSNQRHQP